MSKRRKYNLIQIGAVALCLVFLALTMSAGSNETLECIYGGVALACLIAIKVCASKKKNLCKVCGEEYGVPVEESCVGSDMIIQEGFLGTATATEVSRRYDVVYECPNCKSRWPKREKRRA